MSDIVNAIQKPEWWFSTILVAVIANVVANYIYDWLRPRMAGRWLGILRFSYSILVLGMLVTSSFFMPLDERKRFTIVGACVFGFVGALLELVGFTKTVSGKFLFMQMLTLASLLSLMFLEAGFSTAWQSRNINWFATEFFTAIMVSLAISLIIHLVFVRQFLRKRRGLK